MSFKNVDSTGVVTFDESCNSEILQPQQLPAQVMPPGEATESNPMNLKIVVQQVDVGNATGNTVACGWGYKYKMNQIQLIDGDSMEDITMRVAAGEPTETDNLIVLAPEKFHSIGLFIDAVQSTTAANVSVWDGDSFELVTELAVMTPDDGFVQSVFLPPYTWAPVAANDELNLDGARLGMFAALLQLDNSVWFSDCSSVRLVDYVGNVASTNELSKQFTGEKPIPASCPIVPYISEANDNNWCQVDFTTGA